MTSEEEQHAIDHTRVRMVKAAARSLRDHGITDSDEMEHILAINVSQVLGILLVKHGWRVMPAN